MQNEKTYNGKLIAMQPVCGPYSVSLITGVDFSKVMDYWREQYGKKGRWKGRSTIKECKQAIKHLKGLDAKEVDSGGSLTTWVKKNAMPNRTYFIRLGGHFVTYKDGEVYDQGGNNVVSKHWTRRKHVTHAYEIQKSSEASGSETSFEIVKPNKTKNQIKRKPMAKTKVKKFRICKGDGKNYLAHGENIQDALADKGLTLQELFSQGGYFQTL